MFCQMCTSMLEAIGRGVEEQVYDIYFEEIILASDAGCYICVALTSAVTLSGYKDAKSLFQWRYSKASRFILAGVLLPEETWKSQLFVTIKPIPDTTEARRAKLYQPPKSTSDPAAHKLVEHWLSQCIATHDICDQGVDPLYKPPRLLDLRSDRVRIVLGEKVVTAATYATLSHCWGSAPTFRTLTAENLEAFCVDIPLAELPKTFKDAILLCKSLKIQYLWIDSLCIIQAGTGSEDDWLSHVAMMPKIYKNGLLNIAADWARSSEEGLFIDRNVRRLERPVVSFTDGFLRGSHYLSANFTESLDHNLRDAPLQTRGWVLQERLLSPRVAHFAKDQMCWECACSGNVCEVWPEGSPSPWSQATQIDRRKFGLTSEQLPLRNQQKCWYELDLLRSMSYYVQKMFDMPRQYQYSVDIIQFQTRYWHIVEDYSKRQLSYPDSDKLPAFSALAEFFSDKLKSDYVAGYFVCDFPSALSWSTTAISRSRPTTSANRCPTWSWASVDTPICLPVFRYSRDRARHLQFASLRNYDLRLRSPRNQFGQLESATLVLQTRLFRGNWRHPDRCEFPTNHPIFFTGPDVKFDSLEELSGSRDDVKIALIEAVLWPPTILDTNEREMRMEVFVLIVRELVVGNFIRIGGGMFEAMHHKYWVLQSAPLTTIILV